MTLRDQLTEIYDQHRKLTPRLVVDTARDPSHPLHNHFEWDDAVAGEEYRREQARKMIRTVRVVYKPADEQSGEKSIRAFHAIRKEDGHVFEPVDKVIADEFLTELLMRDMEREWQALKRRYEHFEEFWRMIRKDAA